MSGHGASGSHHRMFRPGWDPLAVGVPAAAVSLIGAGRPSFWYDEAATISAAYSRSLGQLWQMLGTVDAVHGLYYLLMHGWFRIFPPTEFWSRAPSAVAIGGAAAGVVVLGKQFSSRTAAITAGLLCGILPRSTWAGIEARPYAMSMMAAVWLTVLFMHATRSESRWVWPGYGVVLAVSTLLDVYLLLLWPVHAVFIAVVVRSTRRRRGWAPFAVTSVLTAAALAPFVRIVAGQERQISWIAPIGRRTVEDVVVQQYFERNPWFALASALVVLVAVVRWVLDPGRLRASEGRLLILAVAWLSIPTAAVVIRSMAAHPVYTPRYLAFTAPAVALILGVCIAAISTAPWIAASIVTVFAVVAAPNYVRAQHDPYAKYGMDYSRVADLIGAEARPGDCLLVNDTVTFMPAPMRPLLAARPDAYRDLVDLTLWQRATDRRDVFDTNLIPEVIAEPLSRCPVVWIITEADGSVPARETGAALDPGPRFGETPAFAVPAELGFRLRERWQFNLVQVLRAER